MTTQFSAAQGLELMTHFGSIKSVFAATALCAGFAAPVAHAQQTTYDITLRSISPATISPSAYDGRLRQNILSIGPASLENQPGIVPAVYDPTSGRFVSAIGTSRGAIAVNSTGAVSVVVNSQNSSLQLGGASGFPLRSGTVSSSPAEVTSQQISATTTTTASASAR